MNLLAKLMVLVQQILFNLAIAAIAEATMMRVSAEQVPFLHRVALRYLKLLTSFNFKPFILISKLTSFLLLVVILLFSVPTSNPCALAKSSLMSPRRPSRAKD